MIVYSIIMFISGLIIIVVGAFIYSGRTSLIHGYHQQNVKDKKRYGKAMGKAIIGMGLPLIISGAIAIFTTSVLAIIILIIGLIISFIPLFLVQKKYNGGMFSD